MNLTTFRKQQDTSDHLHLNSSIEETCLFLQKLGLPALPVAPAQDAGTYPKRNKLNQEIERDKDGNPVCLFTGKNPSYLDGYGKPQLIRHTEYQKRLPSPKEIELWFAHSQTGIGTLGGWNGFIFIDFDVKHFESQADCDCQIERWLNSYPLLRETFTERTHSGGYRFAVKVKETPDFTNFALTSGGQHLGEALGEGRFTVLAPTIGNSGNAYRSVKRVEPIEVENLESIGIYSSRSNKPVSITPQNKVELATEQQQASIPLDRLGSEFSRQILKGCNADADRSKVLTAAIKEWYGWENWTRANNIRVEGFTEKLALKAGSHLGLDHERIKRILKSINSSECQPALEREKGGVACWAKIRSLQHSLIDTSFEIPSFAPEAEKIFTQTAFEALYEDKAWLCVNGELHSWTGTYYQLSPDEIERKRIRDFCNSYAVLDKVNGEERWTYKYATAACVEQVFRWVKQSLAVDPRLVNPPGLNCVNGVLEIAWQEAQPSWQLVKHDPTQHLYTYEPSTNYDPEANPEMCDRLLACLDAPQLDVFLKTIAASLDLETVRQYKGRAVRSLLLKGDGNNGKDTLRELVKLLYGGQGLTGATFSDFQQYDQGRKFPLAKLAKSRVNWSPENRDFIALDKLQSLKASITGDPIDIEGKGKDEYQIEPKCVFLFNINDTPNLKASLEAIRSRFGILTFTKVFKDHPDLEQGEIQAEPRFRYDPEFMKTQVLPAFINRILAALQSLMADGLDYSCTETAMEEIRERSSHLYLFCKESGLTYAPSGKVYAGEIWQRLEAWYLTNCILIVESTEGKVKRTWIDQVNRSDKNVKGSNQVIQRFREVFPKAKTGTDKEGTYLIGIAFPQNVEIDEAVVRQL